MGRRKRVLVVLITALMFQNSLAQTIFNIPLIKNQDFPTVVPGGEAIGIKLYTKGLLVIETASFEDNKGKSLSDAIACWKYKKSIAGHNRYERADLVALEK